MTDIASRSRYATTGLLYDLLHIVRSVLHQIGEEHRIAGYDREASTSHGPSIRPPVSSTPVHMQPIRGRGRGRGRVDHRGRGGDGGRGHGRDGERGRGTLEPTLPTSIPPILTHHSRFLYPRHLHIFTISGVARTNLHSSRYHLIIPPFIIPYIATHR